MSKEYKKYIELAFSNIPIENFKAKLIELENVLPKLPEEETYSELKKAFLGKVNGVDSLCYVSHAREYKIGGFFYRVRKLEQPIKYLEHSDFWEAPPKFIKYGRLNKPEQQLLYISPGEIETPKKEVGILEKDFFLIVRYEVLKPINVISIGFKDDTTDEFTADTNDKINLITEFINRMFLVNGKHAYKVSSVIAQDICEFENYDGWVYPSVAHKGGENLCLKLTAKNKLKVHSASICQLYDGKNIHKCAVNIDKDENIIHYIDWDKKDSIAKEIINSWYSENCNLSTNEVKNDTKFELKSVR